MAQADEASGKPDERTDVQAGTDEEKGKENEVKADEFCFECKSSLAKSRELINVTGQYRRRWHPECFRCIICREPMDKRQSCHVYKDQIVCNTDYLRLKRANSIKCKRCHWPIGASDWVRKAANYVYHLACFNCDICFRQLNTGEQFVINSQPVESDGTNATDGECNNDDQTVRLMCKLHFTVEKSKQDGGNTVVDPSGNCDISPDSSNLSPGSVKPNKPNHQQSSAKHNQCKQSQRHQAIKSDHLHLLTPSIASCSSSIMSSNNHQAQTSSVANSHRLQSPPPSSSQMTTQLRTMSEDFSLMTSSPNSSSLMIDETFITQHHRIPSTGSTTSSSTTSSSSTTKLGCASGSMTPTGCSSGGLQSKSKRVRTTFTEDQLSILQTHFQIDSNPDGQDLERIATITGLSKRVTQVWFQNSRARQKKYMIKRKPAHGSSSSMAGMGHVGAHHSHHHHHGSRQHHAHQSLALINQSMDSPNGNSPSPNLELSSSPMEHSSGLDHQRLQARFGGFSRQFHDLPFGLKSTIDKENEIINRDMRLGGAELNEPKELIEMESDDEEQDAPEQIDNQNLKDDELAQSSQTDAGNRSTR